MNKKNIISASDKTALKLKVLAKGKERVRRKLVVTAKGKERVRRKLVVTAKGKERVRRKLVVTAKGKERVRRKLVVTAKGKERVRRKLVVTAEGKESVRRKLAVAAEKLRLKAKQLAVTAKDLENANIVARNALEDLGIENSKVEMARAKEEAILVSIGDGLLATDKKGNITLINKTAEKLLGKKSKEVMGKVFSEVILMEDGKGVPIPLKKRPSNMALATSATTTTNPTYYYVRKDKTKFPVAIMVTPVILDGKVIGTIEVFRDITREKEIDKAKSEFISLASHQLKTPPTAIKLLTERLLGGKMGEFTKKQKEYIDDIRSSNQRMIDLVNALLNVSRIELGAFTIRVNEKNVCAIVQSILDELKSVIDKKQLKLKTISRDMNAMLMLDETLFRIVINNLVTNAIRYTAKGGDIRVECKVVNKGQTLGGNLLKESCFVVVVSDTGYGIPRGEQSKVFTKFFRADNAREKLTDGTGLGLYIVKSILDHSGGLIWFTSRENKGSVFYAAIPMTGMRMKAGKKELIA